MATSLCFSRRRFLAMGCSTLAFASAAAHPEQLINWKQCAYSDSPGDVPTPHARATDTAKQLTVPVRINGQGPYHFIVDTGADHTVVATEVGQELGLLRGAQVMLDGVVQAVLTDTVSIRDLTFGSITTRNLSVPTLPRSLLDSDGYLGLDFLDGHRVTFDFKAGLLQVGDPRPRFSANWVPQNEARVRIFGSAGHLRSLDCKVDGVTAAAFIDSGAEVSAANAPLLTALARRNPTFGEIGDIELTDITGGQMLGKVAIVKQIRLPGLGFDDCPLVIANFQVFKAWGLSNTPALLIGMNLLRQFSTVSVDYGLKELRFDLAETGPRRTNQTSIA